MKNQFFIKNGSLCFVIPVFTENSYVCKAFFDKLEGIPSNESDHITNLKRRAAIKRIKNELISQIKTDYFSDIKPNFPIELCKRYKGTNHEEPDYNGRFLCKCMSSAVKFHDDISQIKKRAQFFLDRFEVKYKFNDFECEFKFNTLLYLMHENDEKVAYLLIEINMEDISDFCLIDRMSVPGCIKSEQIIFIKHLFYKIKMKLQINRTGKNKETVNDCSLQQWVNDYVKQICIALKLNYKIDVPEYVSKRAFEYSFIELKEICDINGNELYIDFNDIDKNFFDKYSQQAYGLLLSDEGWEETPENIIRNKLQDYWTTRNFLCSFFLQHNVLLFNLKNSEKGKEYKDFGYKWFSKYQENKYSDYISEYPCLTGIDSLSIFPLFTAIYKEINIDRFECNYKNNNFEEENFESPFGWDVLSKQINAARSELESLQEILNKTSLNLGEIANVERCIYKQFGIIDKTRRIKELYKQKADKLNFLYENANNVNILNLTLLTFLLGIFSLIVSILK